MITIGHKFNYLQVLILQFLLESQYVEIVLQTITYLSNLHILYKNS